MKTAKWDSGLKWGDLNLRWSDPSFILEPGDPGYVPPPVPPTTLPATKKKRKYMASNPTPDRYDELAAAGEDLCDGLNTLGVTIDIKNNTYPLVRADLDALLATHAAQVASESAQVAPNIALRIADSNGKAYISRCLKVLRISLGESWSAVWIATGLPDNSVSIPGTQDKRYTALKGLKDYFTASPAKENADLAVTAAIANTLHAAITTARAAVQAALAHTKDMILAKNAALAVFRKRFRDTVDEIADKISAEDSRWYQFGLNRPADPAQPGVPAHVIATALGTGRVLVQIDGARRANSFDYYKQVIGTDAEPVKATNTEGTQYTFTGLPVGATVQFTVTGVNDAGEGQPSAPAPVVVT